MGELLAIRKGMLGVDEDTIGRVMELDDETVVGIITHSFDKIQVILAKEVYKLRKGVPFTYGNLVA